MRARLGVSGLLLVGVVSVAIGGCHGSRAKAPGGHGNSGGGGGGGPGGGMPGGGGDGGGVPGGGGDGGGVPGVSGDGGGSSSGGGSDGATGATTPGLGATPHPGGVTFRVWAPDAARVFVSGDFNAWSASANELAPEKTSGYFGGDVAGASVGQSYAYVLVASDGTSAQHADPRARQLVNGQGVIVDPSAFTWTDQHFTPPPPGAQVIYELHLGTFNRAAAPTIGTFKDAAVKLDYLQQLGINMIEVMPPVQCATESTWGYNPSWPFAIHDAYGTPDDARNFVAAAHARGLGVIFDVVYNHLSSKTPLWCWDGACLGSGNGGVYFYLDAAKRATPWGPRPDFSRAEVRDYIHDNVMMWLDEYHGDGLRFDSVVSIRETTWNPGAIPLPEGWSLLRALNDAVHALPRAQLTVAEDLQGWDPITAATAAMGGGFDTQWDAAFFNPIDAALVATTDAARDMTQVAAAVAHRYNGVATQRVVYTEDHDQVANGRARIPDMIAPGNPGGLAARQRSTLGAGIVFTAPGIPMIFMGQEFLESGSFDGNTPLDWSKTITYSGIAKLYRKLIQLRRNSDGNTGGLTGNNINVYHVNNNAKVIAYQRWGAAGGDDVIILANFSATSFPSYIIGLPRPGTWHVRFSSDDKSYSPDFGGTPTPDVATVATPRDGFAQQATLALGPYELVILSQ
jgi:1,4-alpha-glucan branching enzyme